MIAVVLGSSGLVGREMLRALLAQPETLKVKAITRHSLGLTDAKLEEVHLDCLSQLSAMAPRLKGDVYFSALGTTRRRAGSKAKFHAVDFQANLDFARLAEGHGAKSYVLISATGANSASSFFYNRVKGDLEAAVAKLSLPSITIFRPALLTGGRSEFRFFEKVAESVLVPLSGILPSHRGKRMITHAQALGVHAVLCGLEAKPGLARVEAKEI